MEDGDFFMPMEGGLNVEGPGPADVFVLESTVWFTINKKGMTRKWTATLKE